MSSGPICTILYVKFHPSQSSVLNAWKYIYCNLCSPLTELKLGGGGVASKSNTCDEDMNLITPNSVVQDIPTSADRVYTL